MTVISTWTTLETVKDTVLDGKIGAMTSIAAVIAAILAAMSVLKTSKDYVNGHGTDLWSLICPLVLLLMTCQFNALVLRPLDSMINIFTRDIASNVNITTSEYISKWGENMLDMGEIALETNKQEYFEELAEQAEKSFVTQFFMTIWLSFKKLLLDRFHITSLTIGSAIGGILFLIVKILLFVQQLLNFILQLIMLLLAVRQLLLEIRAFDVLQHIVNGGNTHFHTGIAFPQKFDGILFNHFLSSLSESFLSVCPQGNRVFLIHKVSVLANQLLIPLLA